MPDPTLNLSVHIMPAYRAHLQLNVGINMKTEFDVLIVKLCCLTAFDKLTSLVRQHSVRKSDIAPKTCEGVNERGCSVGIHGFDLCS